MYKLKLRDTMFDLLSYKCLEADWDGYGSIKPIPQKISEAWEFLGVLLENKVPVPTVMISGNSLIGFYWSKKVYNKDAYIEIDIYSKGDGDNDPERDYKSFAWLVDKGGDDYDGDEDIKFEDFKDSKIHNYIKELLPPQELDRFDEYYFNLFANKEIKNYEDIDNADKEIDEYFANKPKKPSTKMMPVPSDEAIEVLHGIVNGEPLSADFAEIIQINIMDLLD